MAISTNGGSNPTSVTYNGKNVKEVWYKKGNTSSYVWPNFNWNVNISGEGMVNGTKEPRTSTIQYTRFWCNIKDSTTGKIIATFPSYGMATPGSATTRYPTDSYSFTIKDKNKEYYIEPCTSRNIYTIQSSFILNGRSSSNTIPRAENVNITVEWNYNYGFPKVVVEMTT